MSTLSERCKAAGLKSAAELTQITGTSKETLTNWMRNKESLFNTVLKGAAADKKANAETSPIPDAATPSSKEPEQTYAFSYEDLQEQAKLIERLTTENQRLTAELQIASRKTTPRNQEAMATLEQKLNQAEYEAREISKKWHLEQKKARKLADEKEFMQEKIIFLLSEVANLKELKDKRGFVSNAKNAREKSFLEK